ncbi:GAF and ANTAR domain-containing protein [Nocardioides xinjiangensis]|uniref:GAF and ANTAR domain-containing protein n=1 Tax=Nocardioides xinjiangensis TaxID=2817376 RepID=UPI001B314849|nr:GAF and ANTAR domain-containing protein [Nocardioides sp. SYSU D00778]
MGDARELVSGFTQLAQALAAAPDEAARLQIGVDSAVTLVNRCDHAGITINSRAGVVTKVGSDDVVRRANDLQYQLGEGPCLDVLRDQDTLISTDLMTERRWPQWAPRVHRDLGVRSMMSLLVYTDRVSYGALSLYARSVDGFDADDLAVGQAVAGHLSVIMSAGREIDQLGMALQNRTMIGRAQGILMERLDMTEDQSFDYLRRVSSNANRKLVDVASEIVRTRQLPLVAKRRDDEAASDIAIAAPAGAGGPSSGAVAVTM